MSNPIHAQEQIGPDYYKRLAASFNDHQLRDIEMICFVMSHSKQGQRELREACKQELSTRLGPPVLTQQQDNGPNQKQPDLTLQLDYEQKQIVKRFTSLMVDSGIHGTQFSLTVIGAGHEGDHALVSLKVDLFNTSDQYVNFNQKQINLMKDYRLKMLKLEAPDSSPFFYITLLDNSDIVKAHGCDKAVVLQSMEEHDADKAKGIIR